MKEFLVQMLAGIILCVIGYGVCALLGWLMALEIPIPLMIVGFCFLVYRILKEV